MFSIPYRATVLAALAVTTTLALTGCTRAPEIIKIGVAQPLSGDLAGLGKDMLYGVQLAVDEINKQGFKIGGNPAQFEVVALDDKGQTEEAKKIAQQLVDAGVVAVVGHLNSDASIQAAPIYAKRGVAQLAISTNPQFTELGHATTLRLVANDNLQARAVGSYGATQMVKTKFAVVDDGTVYGKGLANDSAKLLEGRKTVVIRQSFDDKTKEFTALAAKIQADGVEVVLTTLGDFQVIALISALEKIGYSKQVSILGTDTIKTAEMIQYAGKVASMYATSPVLDVNELPGGAAFLTRYTSTYKTAPAYGSHYSYDAAYILLAAIKQSGSAEPAKITETLHSMNGFAPVTGAMRWTDKGEQRQGMVGVYTVRGAQWESVARSDKW
jgi:branched-chain amino acid transport system substrate-binding protein